MSTFFRRGIVAAAFLSATVCAEGSAACNLPNGTVTELRARADSLFREGSDAAADTCLAQALAQITSQLEALAAEAEALRAYRDARRQYPDAAAGPAGCMVAADGSSVCLTRTDEEISTAGEDAAVSELSIAPVGALPQRVEQCVSEGEALALLQRQDRGECDGCTSPSALESALVHAAHRHWWEAARGAVDRLRGQNLQVSHETRRSLTLLRDEAGSVLTLLRQTRMDEATIHCAVMWAQGENSVHLNVKFASRLDAPVTVLNVDNEQVRINATHIYFEGIGRQKPKRYVVDLELYGEIDAEASSWSFGSVGTVRFRLKKATGGDWKRLAKGEPNSKVRVWWEHQEQVQKEDKRLRQEAEKERREREAKEKRGQEAKDKQASTDKRGADQERQRWRRSGGGSRETGGAHARRERARNKGGARDGVRTFSGGKESTCCFLLGERERCLHSR